MNIDIVMQNLKERGFTPFYFKEVSEAIKKIKELIPVSSSIGFGGSETVKEIKLLDALKEDYELLHRDFVIESAPGELYKRMHNADWYVCSTNALTVSGDLINIDGRANRVAAMLNGPKNLLVVCGTNKIVETIDEGISRTRNVAAVKNTHRLNKNTPCAVSGECCYCNSPDTICKATVIQHHPCTGSSVYIVIIDKTLGY